MGWEKTASIDTAGGGKVRIKTKQGEVGLTNLEEQQVGSIVAASRQTLQQVIAELVWPTNKAGRDAHAARYFLTPASGPTQDQLGKILSVLELTMNGINGKINVKVADDPSAYGYVGFQTGATGVARGIFSPRHNFGTRQGKIVSRGDIHMDLNRINRVRPEIQSWELGIITFIHEATHKYASTADHGDSGYLNNDGLTFDAPGLTTAQALNNADSYAWFCFAVCNR